MTISTPSCHSITSHHRNSVKYAPIFLNPVSINSKRIPEFSLVCFSYRSPSFLMLASQEVIETDSSNTSGINASLETRNFQHWNALNSVCCAETAIAYLISNCSLTHTIKKPCQICRASKLHHKFWFLKQLSPASSHVTCDPEVTLYNRTVDETGSWWSVRRQIICYIDKNKRVVSEKRFFLSEKSLTITDCLWVKCIIYSYFNYDFWITQKGLSSDAIVESSRTDHHKMGH